MAKTTAASSPITVSTITGGWAINGGNGADTIDATVLFNGKTGTAWQIIAGNGADVVWGSSRAEVIWGDSKGDTDTSSNGADQLHGGGGNDEIHGGNGADILWGDAGGDDLYGGRGGDIFKYNTHDSDAVSHQWVSGVDDWIHDFSKSDGDKLDLTGIALTGSGHPDELTWYDTPNHAYGVWIGSYTGGDKIVYADTDGDGQADVAIRVTGTIDSSGIVGLNHGPVGVNDSNSVIEDHTVSGNVATNDSDPDGDTRTYSICGTGAAGLTLNADGSYSFDASNAAYQHLGAGVTYDAVTTIKVSDGHGGTATETLTIHITGVNDAASFGGDDSGTVTEDTAPNPISGVLTVSDADDGQSSIVAQTGVTGSNGYGSFSIDSNGNWTYTLDNSNGDVNALNVGDQLQDTLTVQSADGTTHTITVTIDGANDAATFGPGGPGVDEGDVDETGDGGVQLFSLIDTGTTTGHIDVSDVDSPATVQPQDNVATDHGTFSIDENGDWTYTVDQDNPDVQALNDGDDLTETVTIQTADGTSHDIVITIHGANDAAEFSGDDGGSVTEDADPNTVSGTLTVSDVDNPGLLTPQTDVAGDNGHGTFTVGADGQWTYTLDNTDPAVNALNTDSTPLTDTITVTSDDGSTHQITVTINGANDAATFGGDDSGAVTEDADPNTVVGTLTVSDVDSPATLNASEQDGSYGHFSMDGDGNWTYTLDNDNATVNALNSDSTPLTETFTVSSGDGTTHDVTVTINGANDAAQFSGDDSGSVTEDAVDNTVSGTLTVSDVDNPGLLTPQTDVAGDNGHGTFTVGADGQWTYTLDNSDPAVNALNSDSAPLTDTITVTSDDGSTHQISVTINGANDAAAFSGDDTGTVTEDDSNNPIIGQLIVDDVDNAGAVTVQNDVAGDHGTFSIDASGNWTYTLDNGDPTVNALNAGDHLTDTFTVTTDDGSTHDVVVTIDGANDAPTAEGTNSVTTDEDNASAAIAIGASDVDSSSLSYSTKDGEGPANGSVSYDQDAGTFTYTPDSNFHGSDSFTIVIDDGDGGTTEQVVSVTVNSVNDAPTADATNSVTTNEDTASTAVAIGASDVDGDSLSYATKSGAGPAHGSVTYNQGAGTFTYTPSANYNGSDSFTILVSDGHGGTTEQVVSVTVNPVDDAGSIGGTNTGSVTEDAVTNTASGSLTLSDVDGPAGFVTQTNAAGTYGTFSVDASGNWTYTLNNADTDTNALNDGQHPTDSFTVTANDGATTTVTVTVNGHTDAPAYTSPTVYTGGGDPYDYDSLTGGAANNTVTIHGTNGNDTITGGPADQNIDGGGSSGADTIYGGAGNDTITGGGGNDTLYGQIGNDSVSGENDNDTIYGGSGNDTIVGGGGADNLYGGSGNDTITGSADADRIIGGYGADTLTGNTGGVGAADTFVYLDQKDTGDTITDFSHAEGDKIDLSGSDPNATFYCTAFVGDTTTPGALAAHSVGYHFDGTNTIVYVDTDGVAGADLEIKLTGNVALQASDFILHP